MTRAVTGWLWRFVWFRHAVIAWVGHGWAGHRWLAVNTPFSIAMRAYLSAIPGNEVHVAAIDKILREDSLRRGSVLRS